MSLTITNGDHGIGIINGAMQLLSDALTTFRFSR